MLKRHSRFFESLMLGADVLVVAAAWLGACLLRFAGFPIPAAGGRPPWRPYLALAGFIPFIWAGVFKTFGLYRPRRLSTRLAEVREIARACSIATLILIAVSFFFVPRFEFSRLVFLNFWALSIAAVALARGTFREGLRLLRRRGFNLRFGLVVGDGEPAERLIATLRRHPELGIRLVGLLAERGTAAGGQGLPLLGKYGDVDRVVAERAIDQVFVALPHEALGALQEVLDRLAGSPAAIQLIPDFGPLLSRCRTAEEFDGLPVLSLQDPSLYGWDRALKRGLDAAGSALLLVLLAPLLGAVALLIRGLDGRPILYRQERMGLDGRLFRLLKFRTMRVDAEAETGPVWTTPDDPRRTRLGALLRRLSLDELPQLWNVLMGEMSLVGPRPERPMFVERFRRDVPQYLLRQKVKAGITGWAQVNGWRGNTPVDLRMQYDLYYMENWSLALDLKILWLTLWHGLIHRNAY